MKSLTSTLLLICLLHWWTLKTNARALGPRAPFVASGQSVDEDVYLDLDDDGGTDHGRDGQTKYIKKGQRPQEERVDGARKKQGDMMNINAPKKPITPLALNTKPVEAP
eukprot:XP_011677538.1 PREDICTED: uncharacterized protein LOC105444680 [Strongylocentrotus purpuratus]